MRMNDERDRDDGGKYTEEIPLDSVLEIFEEVEIPVLTSKEVADALDCSRQAAYNKLEKLSDGDVLIKKKVGAKGAVYIQWDQDDRGG
jgi:CTP-dependent riboflavin kinase